jgi:arsenate reductase
MTEAAPQRILFLCTGNSCRSIMAEALVNDAAGDRYAAWSAGSSPAGHVHPRAIETLARHGVAPGLPRSKSWDEFAGAEFDLVITVCDQAVGESCPIFAGKPKRLHWSIPDPARAVQTSAELDAAFENSFSLLKAKIERLVK